MRTEIIGDDYIDIPGLESAIRVPMEWYPRSPWKDRRRGPVLLDSSRLEGGRLEIRHDGIDFSGTIMAPERGGGT